MFVSKEHHPQILHPSCYHSPEHFECEMERLFRPGWHCIGTLFDLPNDGDYKTLDLFGNPLLVWRRDGQVQTFLNVCAHRYCMLTNEACGNLPSLKCQYHGWEYDETGNTQRIPDAKSFRPMERGMLGLKPFRTETCGQLIFVNLSDEGPGLAEFLGPGYDVCREWFHDELRPTTTLLKQIDANWKCLVENALESYHTAEVHPKTFGQYPDEETCTHTLYDDWTALNVQYDEERSFRRWLDDYAHRRVGKTPSHQYDHILYYPNLMLARLSLYTWFESIIPITPSKSVSITCIFCYAGKVGRFRGRRRAYLIARWGRKFLTQIAKEDAGVLPSVHRGLAAPDSPIGGLISTREERIVHFQEYIHRATGCRTLENGRPQGELAELRERAAANQGNGTGVTDHTSPTR